MTPNSGAVGRVHMPAQSEHENSYVLPAEAVAPSFSMVYLIVKQCSLSRAGWLITKVQQLPGCLPLARLEVRQTQMYKKDACDGEWAPLCNPHELTSWELASASLQPPLDIRATTMAGRTSTRRQMIHLHDPLSNLEDGSPIIALAFWADLDDMDSSEAQSSTCSHEILDCVCLDGGVLPPSHRAEGDHAGDIHGERDTGNDLSDFDKGFHDLEERSSAGSSFRRNCGGIDG
ncbi:hypothetical protein WJX84_003481 [Apatococcus fuscideae]|uniref:Uncharacterized protein n=1 Tax=Apatococcus fuscideae TaxID=2026836 RepID=A0AAW1TDC1_9CHLO